MENLDVTLPPHVFFYLHNTTLSPLFSNHKHLLVLFDPVLLCNHATLRDGI
jgi:hypothetical protein